MSVEDGMMARVRKAVRMGAVWATEFSLVVRRIGVSRVFVQVNTKA
jgi:hypothetical protein